MKSEKGFTLIDTAISIIVLFIFVSLIAFLIYNANSVSKELEYKSTAINIAIEEIEKIKNIQFNEIANRSVSSGNSIMTENEETDKEGFYKTIVVEDYTDIKNKGIPNLVKKVTVEVTYNLKGNTEKVDLSTIVSKEN